MTILSQRIAITMRVLAAIVLLGMTPSVHAYLIACVWPVRFPSVHLKDVTLEQAIQCLRESESTHQGPMNLIIDTSHISPALLARKLSFDEDNITAEELIFAICKRFGVGYKMEPYAILISGRERVHLPDPPTRRVEGLPDGAPPKRYVVFVVSPK